MFNNNRFKSGVTPEAPALSFLSQQRHVVLYLFVCFGVSTIIYSSIQSLLTLLAGGLPFVILVYSTINFHHYIVDSIIWRMRKRPPAQGAIATVLTV
jgi:hypothetical protein